MKIVNVLSLIIVAFVLFSFTQEYPIDISYKNGNATKSPINIDDSQCTKIGEGDSVKEIHCTSTFNGDVNTYSLKSRSIEFGKSIWISRKSKKAKAKYFAHQEGGMSVPKRYANWKNDRSVNAILKSSGAYATGWKNTNIPVGVTVDNGIVVNRLRDDDMDGLVIVYATGGIAVSNIPDGDLYLASLNKRLNINQDADLTKFLNWAQNEEATVFQLHLMAYKNEIRIDKITSSAKVAKRKLLALAKSSSGELFHIMYYINNVDCTLYDATEFVFNHLRYTKGMNVIAMVNLDTGLFDILNTEGGTSDCEGSNVWGASKREKDMTNILTYSYH